MELFFWPIRAFEELTVLGKSIALPAGLLAFLFVWKIYLLFFSRRELYITSIINLTVGRAAVAYGAGGGVVVFLPILLVHYTFLEPHQMFSGNNFYDLPRLQTFQKNRPVQISDNDLPPQFFSTQDKETTPDTTCGGGTTAIELNNDCDLNDIQIPRY